MLTIIGDVHGKFIEYRNLLKTIDGPTLQLGDMGFNYDNLKKLKIDGKKHKFFGGNHDNYDTYPYEGYSLGDYGLHVAGGVKVLYIRGAFSIDAKHRKAREKLRGKSWWEAEELTYAQGLKALEFYKTWVHEVDAVVTHTCPTFVARMIGKPEVLKAFGHNPYSFSTSTQELLQACYDTCKPNLWVFGHFHWNGWQRWADGGCNFNCVGELGTFQIGE